MKPGRPLVSFLNTYLHDDYSLIGNMLFLLGIVGAAGHLLFFVVLELATDYYESLPFRLVVAAVILSLGFFPKSGKFSLGHKIWFECSLAFVLPFTFNFFLLRNDVNIYWSVSIMFAALPYGLLAMPTKALVLYPAATALAMVQGYYLDNIQTDFQLAVLINFPAYFIVLLLGVIQTFIRHAYTLLNKEHQRSESLLHNILPVPIAGRLKTKPGIIADRYDHATILFADIVEFTSRSELMEATEVVTILNEVFTIFDNLVDKYSLEKIKTIGDAYMVACGVPQPNTHHAEVIADMALEIQHSLDNFNQQQSVPLTMRIGIHSGSVVAGIIGIKKFSYDVWGDTVNTASRMESQGLPGEIQVSEQTYQLLADHFEVSERGYIDVKGKGRMKTYLLKGRKAE